MAMLTVNIHEAKTQLSRLVELAAQGETFIIAKAGKPMVKVVPLGKAEIGTSVRLGFMAGECTIPRDFDQMGGDEIATMFAGKRA
jgi:prevent-host-death family protein